MITCVFQKVFFYCTQDLGYEKNLEKTCVMHGIKMEEYVVWLQQDKVRYAKWFEFHETIELEKLVKKQQRNQRQ